MTGSVSAGPASGDYHTQTQPDGTQFEAKQWGNERNHGWEAKNGYTITKTTDGWWMYATVDSGEIVPTDRAVGVDTPPAGVSKHLRGEAQTSPEFSSGSTTSTSSDGPQRAHSVEEVPTSGTVNLPVVLINFNDTSTSYTVTDFQSLIFGDDPSIASGPGSMKDYYEEASNGELTLSGGSSGAQGWYTADEDHDYYGASYSRGAELAREAVRKSDSAMDYSEYDNNNDGVVDGVIVIHQGPGQEASGDPTDIWSHRWSFTGAGLSAYQTDDGVSVNSYTLQPETYNTGITTIGIITHETGHLFEMTDLYDTDGGSEGIGEWGVMGSGNWNAINRPGDSPAHPTAYHKWFMGWISPTEKSLTGPMGAVGPYATSHETYRWRDNPNGVEQGGSGEYFLATNRQDIGFDQALPGHGLIITHIDESRSDNTDESHKLVDIEAADGARDLDRETNRGDSGDPYPGSTSADAFNSSSTPNSNLYDGSSSGISINEILSYSDKVALNPVPVADTPAAVSYGDINIESNGTETATISNTGQKSLNVTSTSISGTDGDAFTISDGGGQQVIARSASSTVNITFDPTSSGSKSATLVVEHNGTNSPTNVSLSGTGVTPDYQLPETSVDFGTVSLENGTSTASFTVKNNGTAPLNISTHSVTGSNPENFSYSGSNPTTPHVIDAGSQTRFDVTFTIGEVATRNAFIELDTNATDRPPINISMTGTGEDRHPPNIHSTSVRNDVDGTLEFGPNGQLNVSATVTDALATKNVTVDATPLGTGTVTLTDADGDTVYNATIPVDAVNATEGSHDLTVTAYDTSNQANTTTTETITLDLTAPSITVETPAEATVQNETYHDVTGTATDSVTSVSSVELRVDGGSWTTVSTTGGEWSYNVTGLSEGSHRISLRAIDNATNVAPITTRNLTADYSRPTIETASLNKTELLPHETIGVTVDATDAESAVDTVSAASATLEQTSGWSGTVSAVPELGSERMTVVVVDAAGNQNTTTLRYDVGRNATLTNTAENLYQATFTDTPVVKNVTLNTSQDVSGENSTIGTATTNPSGNALPDEAGLYFPQVAVPVTNENLTSSTVAVELQKSRYATQYVENETTRFWVTNGSSWDELTATLTETTTDSYIFEIETPHYSTLAVTGTVEDTTPTITPVTPTPGTSTTETNHTITANYTDDFSGIDPATATLAIDGTTVSSGVTTTSSTLSYDASFSRGSHTITVTVADNAGNTATRSWSIDVTDPSSTSSSAGGGGGGGGGTGAGGPDISSGSRSFGHVATIKSIGGDVATVDIGLSGAGTSISSLTVDGRFSPKEIGLYLYTPTAEPTEAPALTDGEPVSYFRISLRQAEPKNIAEAQVRFTVDRNDLPADTDPQSVRLYHYSDGAWTTLPTDHVGGNSYEATTTEFSEFAIGIAPSQTTGTTQPGSGSGPTETESESETPGFGPIAGLLAVISAALYARRQSQA